MAATAVASLLLASTYAWMGSGVGEYEIGGVDGVLAQAVNPNANQPMSGITNLFMRLFLLVV